MKLITLHQPWASLVAMGLKRYETRHWATIYRGPVLIHAAALRMKSASRDVLEEACCLMNRDIPDELPYGAIVALANLSNCQSMRDKPGDGWQININAQSPLERLVGDWSIGRYALRLDNVRPLPEPIAYKSRQGKLLDVPPEVVSIVNSQLTEALTHA